MPFKITFQDEKQRNHRENQIDIKFCKTRANEPNQDYPTVINIREFIRIEQRMRNQSINKTNNLVFLK